MQRRKNRFSGFPIYSTFLIFPYADFLFLINFIMSFAVDCLNYATQCAIEFYNDLCSLISSQKTVISYC